MEVAAEIARARAMQKTGLKPEEIGIIFISPCPSKVSYAKAPLGIEKSSIDNVVAIKDIYPLLLPHMKHDESQLSPCPIPGGSASAGAMPAERWPDSWLKTIWQRTGSSISYGCWNSWKDEKLHGLTFVELNAATADAPAAPSP